MLASELHAETQLHAEHAADRCALCVLCFRECVAVEGQEDGKRHLVARKRLPRNERMRDAYARVSQLKAASLAIMAHAASNKASAAASQSQCCCLPHARANPTRRATW